MRRHGEPWGRRAFVVGRKRRAHQLLPKPVNHCSDLLLILTISDCKNVKGVFVWYQRKAHCCLARSVQLLCLVGGEALPLPPAVTHTPAADATLDQGA